MLRGVGTVVAAALIAVALVAIIVFAYYMLDLLRGYQTSLAEIAGTKAAASLLAGGVTGWYLDTTTTLRIHLESSNPYTILVTTVSILWSDSTYTVYDSQNTPNPSLTATVDTGATSYTVDRLPIAVGPGYTVDIYIDKTALGKTGVDVKTVSVTLSASPVVAVVPLKDYYQLYPNATVVANATQPPAASLYALLASAPRDYTKTIYGNISLKSIDTIYGNITSYTLINGAVVAGDAQSLQYSEGEYLIIDSKPLYNVANFTLQSDNLIYATDFEDGDVFASGEWRYYGGNWSWGPVGYLNNGIYQSDTTINEAASFGGSGEYVACPTYFDTQNLPADTPYYTMAHVYTGEVFSDVVLGSPATDELYTFSILVNSQVIGLWYYYSVDWTTLYTVSAGVESGVWYATLAYFDPTTRTVRMSVYNSSGLVESFEYTIRRRDFFVPTCAGVGTYNSSAGFDNFIVSKANPRYINLTVYIDGDPAVNWNVELYNATGGLVASAATDSNGVAVLNVTWQPIVRGAVLRVYNDNGEFVAVVNAADYLGDGTLYGGNSYELYLEEAGYVIEVYVTSALPSGFTEAGIAALLAVNATSTASLAIYNWSSGSWVSIVDGVNLTAGSTLSIEELYPSGSGVAADNGTVRAWVYISSSEPVRAYIDLFNAISLFVNVTEIRGLIVAVGGASHVEVYNDTGSGLELVLSIPAYTVFNASATIAYNPLDDTLVLINTSGVFETYINNVSKWSLVTSDCAASQEGGVEAEVVNASGHPFLVALTGGGDSYCIVDLDSNATTATGSLSSSLGLGITLSPTLVYPSSAVILGAQESYFLVYNLTSSIPLIVKATVEPNGTVAWSLYAPSPGARSTGLAAAQTSLWLLLERGSLYRVTPTGTTLVNQTLPIVPWGPGDRLEDYNTTHLLWIRADDTREVWLIEKG